MFNIFRLPKENIINKIPQHAVVSAREVERYAKSELYSFNEDHLNHALAFIIGVWATNCAASGTFQLSKSDYDYVIALARTSLRWLSDDQKRRALGVVTKLADQGLMPRQPE